MIVKGKRIFYERRRKGRAEARGKEKGSGGGEEGTKGRERKKGGEARRRERRKGRGREGKRIQEEKERDGEYIPQFKTNKSEEST